MQSLSLHNDGVKHLLTSIDTFSKYAWVRLLQNKAGQSDTEALKSILNKEIPLMLQSDKGTEFKNIQFQSLIKNTTFDSIPLRIMTLKSYCRQI